MGVFYAKLKSDMNYADLVQILLQGQEFQELEYSDEEITRIESQLPSKTLGLTLKHFPDPQTYKTAVHLLGHLNGIRGDKSNTVVGISCRLVQGLLQISIARNWMPVTKKIVGLSQVLIVN